MYLTSEQLAIANQAVVETFEQTCIAWQAIPHWNTCDPGASRVRNDVVDAPNFLNIDHDESAFQLTLVQTSAPTPDSLVAEVIFRATELAAKVDAKVLPALNTAAQANAHLDFVVVDTAALLNNLIDARAKVEDAGYRSPSCLITNTQGIKQLSDLKAGYPVVDELLAGAHVNSLHRTSIYDEMANAAKADGQPPTNANGDPIVVQKPKLNAVMLGRRQLIAHAGAPEASPGVEPVDLAISVPPSLEILGETLNSEIEVSVRIGFALRVKDPKALVKINGQPLA